VSCLIRREGRTFGNEPALCYDRLCLLLGAFSSTRLNKLTLARLYSAAVLQRRFYSINFAASIKVERQRHKTPQWVDKALSGRHESASAKSTRISKNTGPAGPVLFV
jgi:hypothetical protein